MISPNQLRCCVVLLLALNASGCAVLSVTPAPENHATFRYFDCTESDGASYADAVWGASYGTLSIVYSQIEDPSGEPLIGAAIVTGIFAVTHLASAVYGLTTTQDCRQAHQDMVIRSQEADDAMEARIAELERELRERFAPPACETDADCRTGRTCEQARCIPAPPPPPQPIAVPTPSGAVDARPNPPLVRPEPEINTGRPMQPSTMGEPVAPFGP